MLRIPRTAVRAPWRALGILALTLALARLGAVPPPETPLGTSRDGGVILAGDLGSTLDFTRAVFKAGADFEGADLEGRVFDEASLQGARFGGANLQGCRFHRTDLTGADLSQAKGLQEAQLAAATLDGAKLPEAWDRKPRTGKGGPLRRPEGDAAAGASAGTVAPTLDTRAAAAGAAGAAAAAPVRADKTVAALLFGTGKPPTAEAAFAPADLSHFFATGLPRGTVRELVLGELVFAGDKLWGFTATPEAAQLIGFNLPPWDTRSHATKRVALQIPEKGLTLDKLTCGPNGELLLQFRSTMADAASGLPTHAMLRMLGTKLDYRSYRSMPGIGRRALTRDHVLYESEYTNDWLLRTEYRGHEFKQLIRPVKGFNQKVLGMAEGPGGLWFTVKDHGEGPGLGGGVWLLDLATQQASGFNVMLPDTFPIDPVRGPFGKLYFLIKGTSRIGCVTADPEGEDDVPETLPPPGYQPPRRQPAPRPRPERRMVRKTVPWNTAPEKAGENPAPAVEPEPVEQEAGAAAAEAAAPTARPVPWWEAINLDNVMTHIQREHRYGVPSTKGWFNRGATNEDMDKLIRTTLEQSGGFALSPEGGYIADHRFADPVGHALDWGSEVRARILRVVLKWDGRAYVVVTAFPVANWY
jgi:uncharacterized protein YjbI with pentapeptide repeats